MKILKILLVLLVPAVGIVGCQKSNMKPGCSHDATTAVSTDNSNDAVAPVITAGRAAAPAVTMEDTTTPSDNDNAAKFSNPSELDPTDNSTEVIGYGDDDRDGGDKKRKK